MIKNTRTLPFWLFTFSVIMVLVVSQLVQDGVFMDGMLYISVSKNLADGLGTFWNPHFSLTSMSDFHEQPPLYFGLLAIFYKLFGTSMYVERLFCLLCYTITAFFIHKLWKTIFESETEMAKNSWLPVLFWSTIPVCFWAYTNHVEETVMAVFTTISVYYMYCAIFKKQRIVFNLVLAGIFIFLSSLTKGVQGMFPVAGAVFYFMVFRTISFRKMILYSLLLVGVPLVIYGMLMITNADVYLSFKKYFEIRLLGTFANKGATTDTHFDLLARLFMELLPVAALTALLLFFTRKQKAHDRITSNHYKTILWFLFMGLSGSLPLMVTLEQRGFYLVTSFPLFAIGIAMWLAPRLTQWTERINLLSPTFKLTKILSIVLLAATTSFSVMQVGHTKRDSDLLSDVYAIGKIVPHGDIINMPDDMWNDWSLREYLIRNFYISTDKCCNQPHTFFIIRKDLPKNLIPDYYQPYSLPTKEVDLYFKKE